MNLQRIAASPVPVRAGNVLLLISPPSLRDFGFLFRCLESRFGTKPDGSPAVAMGEPEAVAYFTEPEGFAALLWTVARKDQPEMTYDRAHDLVLSLADDPSLVDLAGAVALEVFRRGGAGPPPGDGVRDHAEQPLDAIDFAELFRLPNLRAFAPDAVAGWTLDQLASKLAATTDHGVQVGSDEWARRLTDPEFWAERRRQGDANDADEMGKPHRMN